jgi:hypothetical protein
MMDVTRFSETSVIFYQTTCYIPEDLTHFNIIVPFRTRYSLWPYLFQIIYLDFVHPHLIVSEVDSVSDFMWREHEEISTLALYREDFYFLSRFHGFALHGDRCTSGCVAWPILGCDECFLGRDLM